MSSSCGNIWMRSRKSIPIRRPRKRKRLNAYAAIAPRSTVETAVENAIASVLRYQLTYGASGLCRIWPKLCRLGWSGQTRALDSEALALNAAETVQTDG